MARAAAFEPSFAASISAVTISSVYCVSGVGGVDGGGWCGWWGLVWVTISSVHCPLQANEARAVVWGGELAWWCGVWGGELAWWCGGGIARSCGGRDVGAWGGRLSERTFPFQMQ